MKTATAFAVFAGVASATSWGSYKSYNTPSSNDNKCDGQQQQGYSFGDLNEGSFDQYDNFDFQGGWNCKNTFGKRDPLTKRTFGGKAVTGSLSAGNGPSIKCAPDKDFSVSRYEISVSINVDVEFHYTMKDGSTCKQTVPCKTGGTVVQNTQCGGAKQVSFQLPQGSKDKCDMGIHKIDFDCNPPQTPPPNNTPSSRPVSQAPPPSSRPPTNPPASSAPPSNPPASSAPPSNPPASSAPPANPPASSAPPSNPPASSNPPVNPPASSSPPVVVPPPVSSSAPGPPSSTPVSPPPPLSNPPTYGNSSVPVVVPPPASQPPVVVPPVSSAPVVVPPPASSGPVQPPASSNPPLVVPSVSSTPASPVSSSRPAQPPAPSAPCPDVLPQCLNTWIQLSGCADNSDYNCFCTKTDFTKNVIECVSAYGADKTVVGQALSYFQGICAVYIPQNPGIVTDCPKDVPITPPAVPAASAPGSPVDTTTYTTQVVTETVSTCTPGQTVTDNGVPTVISTSKISTLTITQTATLTTCGKCGAAATPAVTTVKVVSDYTVPCTFSEGVSQGFPIPGSSTVTRLSTEVVVPYVQFTTAPPAADGSTPTVGLAQGPAPTPYAPGEVSTSVVVPTGPTTLVPGISASRTTSSGPLQVTANAGLRNNAAGTVLGFVAGGAMAVLAL